MLNSDDIRAKLVPILAPLNISQDTTSDQLSAFYRPVPVPFVRHSPLPVAAQSQSGAAGKSVSQTQSGRQVYGVTRNLSQIATSTVNQGINSTVSSNTGTVTQTLRNLPTAFTLTGSWTNPQNAIDNDINTYAVATSSSSNIVYLANAFTSFASWFTSNILQVITQVTAVSGGSVIVEYSINSGTSWATIRTVASADSMPVTSQIPLNLSIPTNNIQVRVTLPGSSGGMSLSSTGSPGTFANDATVGTVTWTISSGQGVVTASTSTFLSENTEYFKATNFGFSIPVGATINGIQATIEEYGKSGSNDFYTFNVADNSVKICKAGTPTGTDHALGSNWPQPLANVSYGGTTDLWGSSFAPSDINNSGFGIAISANINISSDGSHHVTTSANIYNVSITVYYTTSSGSTSATARIYDIAQLTTLQ